MIPEIGIMIGCYIITKMLSLSFNKNEAPITRIFSYITIFISAVVILDLILKEF